jgi:hypothetical protein
MSTNALFGAIVGAVIGAAVWAGIAYFTGYEVGYVAWGVGAAVGGLAAMFGSEGSTAGMICAVLALAAIFAGKVFAANLVLNKELDKMAAEVFDRSLYTEVMEDARQFASVTSEDAYPQFMIDRGYTDAPSVEFVTASDIADFKEYQVDELRKLQRESPSYDAWASRRRKEFVEIATEEISVVDAVTEDLGLVDIVFGLLGVVTAYKLGEGLGGAGGFEHRDGPRRPRRPGSGPPRAPVEPRQPRAPAEPSPPRPSGTGQAPVPARRRRR